MGYAGFWKRFAACIIDSLVVGVGSAIIAALFSVPLAEDGGNALYTPYTTSDVPGLILG